MDDYRLIVRRIRKFLKMLYLEDKEEDEEENPLEGPGLEMILNAMA